MGYLTNLSLGDLWFLAEGAGRTLVLTVLSVVFGTLIGLVLGWVRAEGRLVVNLGIGAVLDVIRSVPMIIQLVLFNSFVALMGHPMSPFLSGLLVLSLYMGANCAEVVRAGILAVPSTTRRAARSLGFTYLQDMTHVVLPLGARAVFPAWIGVVLSIMKDTALVSVLGFFELMKSAQVLTTRIQEPLLILIGVGIFYFILSYPIAQYSMRLEKRMR